LEPCFRTVSGAWGLVIGDWLLCFDRFQIPIELLVVDIWLRAFEF